jgi:thiol-disulfide isomerase/thioredoxin
MNRIIMLLLLLCCDSLNSAAQAVLRGNISNVPPSALPVAIMEYWAVDHWQQLTILQLENGAFSTDKMPPVQAQCQIRMVNQPKVKCDFLLPGPGEVHDSVLRINLDMRSMNGSPAAIAGYPENDLYFALMSAYFTLNTLRDTSSAAPEAELNSAARMVNNLCLEMAKKNPGTFTGDILSKLLFRPTQEDYPKDSKEAGMTDNAFAIAHGLEKIPFRSDKILNHIAFEKALNHYYSYFDHTSKDGSGNYVEGIMSRRNGNEAVDLFLFKFLLDKMLASKNENGLQYLLKWHLPDCSDESPLSNYTKTLIAALQSCQPGNSVPDQQWQGLDGNNVSLSAVCAKNKMTLLFFWKSNCSHCREFKPVLAALYEKYHPLGLEVLALSLDKNEAGWKQTLQADPSKWLNGFVPNEARDALSKHFPIPSTPTLISLDKQGKVLKRLILRDQLEAHFIEILGN